MPRKTAVARVDITSSFRVYVRTNSFSLSLRLHGAILIRFILVNYRQIKLSFNRQNVKCFICFFSTNKIVVGFAVVNVSSLDGLF